MYDKPLNGFEPLEEKENTKENYENKYISLVLNSFRWYNGLDLGQDTGASEHITNSKEILSNFREEKNFNSIGSIHDYNIKFEYVLYTQNKLIKNFLSGIKLAKNGLKCKYKSQERQSIFITLKTET